VIRARTISLFLATVLLHALAREVDRALGLVLRAEVEPDGWLQEVARALAAEGAAPAGRVGLWLLAGLVAWAALLWRRSPPSVAPLLLRPALTLVALLSVSLAAAYPYAFTLPVALTQDWAIGQDAAAVAAFLALWLPAPRLPAPRGREVFLLSFLAYAVLVPAWAWQWDSHPGNEPKTLRQAVALGHWLTFDAESVSAAMEELPTRPFAESLPLAAATFGRESWRMLVAVAHGDAGRDAIRATRLARQTVRGKDGGVFSVLAPGPSLLLAPTLRIDRALNRARGVVGRLAVSVLLWCALAAALVSALFRLVRDATGRDGLAAAFAFGFALLPPFLFYFHQFYPEMLGALLLAGAFRTLALQPGRLATHSWRLGWLLAALPWLHQKFLPVWLTLVATALFVGWRQARDEPRWRWTAGVLVPTLVSLYLTALYNFAITGSVRPDALFLAWGPGGVSSQKLGQGFLGLLLDARYGILPYVPVLLLAAAGLVLGGARRFAPVLPAAFVYYLTVASADNWSGAVCNLGRYVMPVVPLGVGLAGIAVARTARSRGAVALALVLAAWTALFAVALRHDPLAANDSALLLAKSVYADARQYIPGLFIRSWAEAAPGTGLRILAWCVGLAAITFWLGRVGRRAEPAGSPGPGGSPVRTLAAIAAFVLVSALVLERAAPGARSRPAWSGILPAAAETLVFLEGASSVREDEATLGPGTVELLVRSPGPITSLPVIVGGAGGRLHVAGAPPLALRPMGVLLDLPLSAYHRVRARDGRETFFSRGRLWVEGEGVLRLVLTGESGLVLRGAQGPRGESGSETMEPDTAGVR
jgi:hypothetical protein